MKYCQDCKHCGFKLSGHFGAQKLLCFKRGKGVATEKMRNKDDKCGHYAKWFKPRGREMTNKKWWQFWK